MLFRKDTEPRCSYCVYGEQISEESVLCLKRGMSTPGGHCSHFSYDPFLRTPPRPAAPDFSRWTDEDFSLDTED